MAFNWRKKMAEKHEVEEEMSMEEILSSIRKYVIDEKRPTEATTATELPGDRNQEPGIRSQIEHAPEPQPQMPSSSANGVNPEGHLEYSGQNDDIIELTNPLEDSKAPRTPSIATAITSAHDEVLIRTPTAPAPVAILTPMLATTPSKGVAPHAPQSQQSIQVNTSLRSSPYAKASGDKSGFEGQESSGRQEPQQMPFQASQQRYPFYRNQEAGVRGHEPSHPTVSTVGLATRNLEVGGGGEEPLVSPQTASDTANAFSRLMQATQQQTSQPTLTGGTTVEELVTDVAKSMVKTWLEQNLSPIVETMVAKEIKRISRS